MADVTLTVYTPSRAGTPAVNFTDSHTNATAGNNYKFANDGRTVLIATDTGGAGATLTADVTATVDGNAVTDKPITIAASKCVVVGPWPISVYGSTASVAVSANTDLLAVSLA